MNRAASLFATLACLLILPAWASGADILRIGVISPLTGPRASLGADAHDGAALAAQTLNEADAGPQIELIFEDSQAQPAVGVAAFQKLGAAGVPAIITQNSNVSLPIMPVASRLRVVQVGITTTSERYASPDDYSFRVNGGTAAEGQAIADFLLRRRAQTPGAIAILALEDEYIQSLRSSILSVLGAAGVEPATDKSFLPSENDFRALIGQLKTKKPVHVAFLAYATHAGAFAKQQAELKLDAATVALPFPVNTAEFFTAAGESAEGMYGTNLAIDENSPQAKRYMQKYGRKFSGTAANAYDAVTVLERAAWGCRGGLSGECLKKSLQAIQDFHGVSGQTGFDPVNGDMVDHIVLLRARNGAFIGAE